MEKITISLLLKPYSADSVFSHMDVKMDISERCTAAGEELFRIQKETVRIPFCPMDGLHAYDGNGEIPIIESEEIKYPVVYKKWSCQRSVEGPMSIRYRVYPRIVPEGYRSSPYFDFRAEEGGANGAGITFLACVQDLSGKLSLRWDLSELPEEARGIWSFGEGDVDVDGEMSLFLNSYYAVGNVKSECSGDYGLYWLSEPPFDLRGLAAMTRALFERMSMFFRDEKTIYRIFVRKDPFEKSGGGTALFRSYMFGYSDVTMPTADRMNNLLAHEMVHNWPHIEDEPYGTCTWYDEGCAEYYSILLPFRFGLVTKEYMLGEIQRRTDDFYTNPTRSLGNMEAAAVCWEDRRAQRIAYGRGLFFLAETDAMIRRTTNGEKNLDNVVLELLERRRKNEKLGNGDFIKSVLDLTGMDISERFSLMTSGVPFPPDRDSFDSLLDYEIVRTDEADTGKPAVSYKWHFREDKHEKI